jgi:hypothetical protein
LPLSAGRYKIELFLECNGIIEDWLVDHVPIDVADSSFFGTARNLPSGWEGRTVLVDHDWRRTCGNGDQLDVRTKATIRFDNLHNRHG